MSGLTALVLAGSRGEQDPVALYAGVTNKALIELQGQCLLQRVVSALAVLPEIAEVVVCVESESPVRTVPLRFRERAVRWIDAESGPSASVAAALSRLGTPLLVTTADHALLQPAWVQHFLQQCPAEADVAVAMARREVVSAALPQTRRTYLRFSDGDYSGCNLFYFARPAARRVADLWQQVEADRKRPLRVIRRLGVGFALRYLMRRLSLDQALRRLRQLSGAHVAVVTLPDGLAAVDVDKPADLDLVRAIVGSA